MTTVLDFTTQKEKLRPPETVSMTNIETAVTIMKIDIISVPLSLVMRWQVKSPPEGYPSESRWL